MGRQYFQHERLVHLLVTIALGLGLMIMITWLYFSPEPVLAGLVVITAILEAAYVIHYYYLENGLQQIWEAEQRWLEGWEFREARSFPSEGQAHGEKQAGNQHNSGARS